MVQQVSFLGVWGQGVRGRDVSIQLSWRSKLHSARKCLHHLLKEDRDLQVEPASEQRERKGDMRVGKSRESRKTKGTHISSRIRDLLKNLRALLDEAKGPSNQASCIFQ